MKIEDKIEALEEELKRLTKLVYHDELTGILNRRGFSKEAEEQFKGISLGDTLVERRTHNQIPYAVIFIDLDDFKKINDTYGHAIGDIALKTVSSVLAEQLRGGDVFGRWGGEEFVVGLLGASAELARHVAEKLRVAIERCVIKTEEGHSINLSASFGVKEHDNEKSVSEMLDSADDAMYEAKKNGKNRVVVYKK